MIDQNAPLDSLDDRRDEANRLRAENAAKTILLLQKKGEIKVLREHLGAAEAERDRAVEYIPHCCATCIWDSRPLVRGKSPCFNCTARIRPKWEWRDQGARMEGNGE